MHEDSRDLWLGRTMGMVDFASMNISGHGMAKERV